MAAETAFLSFAVVHATHSAAQRLAVTGHHLVAGLSNWVVIFFKLESTI